jgi:hypothetical protein
VILKLATQDCAAFNALKVEVIQRSSHISVERRLSLQGKARRAMKQVGDHGKVPTAKSIKQPKVAETEVLNCLQLLSTPQIKLTDGAPSKAGESDKKNPVVRVTCVLRTDRNRIVNAAVAQEILSFHDGGFRINYFTREVVQSEAIQCVIVNVRKARQDLGSQIIPQVPKEMAFAGISLGIFDDERKGIVPILQRQIDTCQLRPPQIRRFARQLADQVH